jgi:6-phosphogluconolactonase (cycloisomerase 2 family)
VPRTERVSHRPGRGTWNDDRSDRPEEITVPRPALVYVGTYTPDMNDGHGRGLLAFRRDAATGDLTQVGELALSAPSYLAWHPALPVLYTANEAEAAVTAVACDEDGGMRVIGDSLPTGGADPCYLETAPDGRHLLVANYGGGSVAVFALGADGELLRRTDLVQHEGSGADPERQEGPHAHMVTLGPGGLWRAVDLGTDAVHSYRLREDGTLDEVAVTTVPPGTGPRHVLHDAETNRSYLVAELGSTLTPAEETAPGVLLLGAAVPASAKPGVRENYPAHMTLSARAHALYVSNRGANTIALFRLTGDAPTLVGEYEAGGVWPRHMAMIGDSLYVANQESDTLAVHTVDPGTGALTLSRRHSVGTPVCVLPGRM